MKQIDEERRRSAERSTPVTAPTRQPAEEPKPVSEPEDKDRREHHKRFQQKCRVTKELIAVNRDINKLHRHKEHLRQVQANEHRKANRGPRAQQFLADMYTSETNYAYMGRANKGCNDPSTLKRFPRTITDVTKWKFT